MAEYAYKCSTCGAKWTEHRSLDRRNWKMLCIRVKCMGRSIRDPSGEGAKTHEPFREYPSTAMEVFHEHEKLPGVEYGGDDGMQPIVRSNSERRRLMKLHGMKETR